MEYVTGGELFDRIVQRGFYSERDAATCVRHMLKAVEYLHENDVVHRDLKPENLLYENDSEDSNLKVADFGLSKMLQNEIQTSTVCGTPGYCAPEILLGKTYDKSVDIWSIGVIAYILLCGYEPFYDEDDRKAYKKILNCDYEFTSPWWDDVSQNGKDFIASLLQSDPKKRPTATKALKHRWVEGKAAPSMPIPNDALAKLKEFNSSRKLKVATRALQAAVNLKTLCGQWEKGKELNLSNE